MTIIGSRTTAYTLRSARAHCCEVVLYSLVPVAILTGRFHARQAAWRAGPAAVRIGPSPRICVTCHTEVCALND